MQNFNVKAFIYVFLVISVLAWLSIAFLMGWDTDKFLDLIQMLPMVATIDLILFGIFAKWGWRWKYFQGWLVPFPALSGTWEGLIQSTWKDPDTGDKLAPIPAILIVKQSFTNISFVMRTKNMVSHSYSGNFMIQEDNQIRRLTYSYTSEPTISLAPINVQHNGTVILEIIGNPVKKLTGCYWTGRKTTGELNFTFLDKKLLHEIPPNHNS